MSEHLVLSLSGICVLAILCQWFAWWVRLPAILFLLLSGIAIGPWLGWLEPETLFGHFLFPMVSMSVAIILFEGSLTLKFDEIRGLEKVVRNMVTIGLLSTWLITAVATHYLLDFAWSLSLLFGAVVVVTGPTVIIPMLRTVRPNAKVANILRWEGIVIDPIGAMLAVLVFEFIISGQGQHALDNTLLVFGKIMLIGLMLGLAGGYLLGVVLRRHWLPEYLHNLATLAMVFGIFSLSNLIQEESGLLTVTVAGMCLANMKNVRVDEILDFKESLSVLLISSLFIILAARVEFSQFIEFGWSALGILLVIQFVARPVKVLISSWRSSLTWQERAILSWIAPRGIVAAAVSALFAIRLEQAGFEQAQALVPLTFMVIIGTVVLQSATSRPIASWLGVAEPEPRGFLIIGANHVARAIANILLQHGYRALLTDSSWDNIRAARMEGLPVYYGNPISEHADRHLDLVGIGRMLALSAHGDLNILANLRYRPEFGANAVYTLLSSTDKSSSDKHRVASQHRGYTLFDEDVTYAKLASLLSKGAEIRSTQLTENFSFEDYREQYGRTAIPMFALDGKGRIQIFVAGGKLKPGAGWTVISLITNHKEQSDNGESDGQGG